MASPKIPDRVATYGIVPIERLDQIVDSFDQSQQWVREYNMIKDRRRRSWAVVLRDV